MNSSGHRFGSGHIGSRLRALSTGSESSTENVDGEGSSSTKHVLGRKKSWIKRIFHRRRSSTQDGLEDVVHAADAAVDEDTSTSSVRLVRRRHTSHTQRVLPLHTSEHSPGSPSRQDRLKLRRVTLDSAMASSPPASPPMTPSISRSPSNPLPWKTDGPSHPAAGVDACAWVTALVDRIQTAPIALPSAACASAVSALELRSDDSPAAKQPLTPVDPQEPHRGGSALKPFVFFAKADSLRTQAWADSALVLPRWYGTREVVLHDHALLQVLATTLDLHENGHLSQATPVPPLNSLELVFWMLAQRCLWCLSLVDQAVSSRSGSATGKTAKGGRSTAFIHQMVAKLAEDTRVVEVMDPGAPQGTKEAAEPNAEGSEGGKQAAVRQLQHTANLLVAAFNHYRSLLEEGSLFSRHTVREGHEQPPAKPGDEIQCLQRTINGILQAINPFLVALLSWLAQASLKEERLVSQLEAMLLPSGDNSPPPRPTTSTSSASNVLWLEAFLHPSTVCAWSR